MVRLAFLFLLFSSFSSPLEEQTIYLTLPKGGSHLIRKVIGFIKPLPFRKLPKPEYFNQNSIQHLSGKSPEILYHHLEPGYELFLDDSYRNFIKVIMIRDPRDVIISLLEWIKVMGTSPDADRFLSLSMEEQITELIIDPDLTMNHYYPFVFDTTSGVNTALIWMQDPSVFVCKFEELVGPEGGGSEEMQKKTLKDLAIHLNCPLTDEEVNAVAKKSFGNTCTFRKGHIGEWKDFFTEEHKKLFKQVLGEQLIALGYEQNTDW